MNLPRTTVLIGPNNCGKTSVIKAMQLALGDYARRLSDEDFNIDDADKRTEKILIDVRIVPLDVVGKSEKKFDDDWAIEFGDKIQADADGNQFFGLRTSAKPHPAKTGFLIERFWLQEWVDFSNWTSITPSASQKLSTHSDLVPFISIDAQRDIHHELNEKSSFVGRVLSQVQYDSKEVAKLEKMIAGINDEAVAKSVPLTRLKEHLSALNESFGSSGIVEVTPFPKKLRDLSKNFSVHFGNSSASSFSMEYHGMGTRSWASMLAVKAFTELMAEHHKSEAEPFHPILAAEEPEAHLHPNAQRFLFQQMQSVHGQTIVSTHSPFLAAMCELPNLRCLSTRGGHTVCFQLMDGLAPSELKTLHREVMRHKGETLFAKALILFEGQTEEQLVPDMFEVWFGDSAFAKGVSMVAVNGRNYGPYVKLAGSLGIPIAIISDNDTKNGVSTKTIVEGQLTKMEAETPLKRSADWFAIQYLSDPNDFEAEIIHAMGLLEEVKEAFLRIAKEVSTHRDYLAAKKSELDKMTADQLLEKMRSVKTGYSSILGDVIAENKFGRTREELVPTALQEAFKKVESWLI